MNTAANVPLCLQMVSFQQGQSGQWKLFVVVKGFYDAFNLDENWRSEIFMGLNQGPIVIMIENYRTGLLWNLFMKNTEVQEGLKKIAAEKP